MALIDTLKRNDIEGSVAAYREAALNVRNRDQLADIVGELLKMHDDETAVDALLERLELVDAEPVIAARLRKLGPVTTAT